MNQDPTVLGAVQTQNTKMVSSPKSLSSHYHTSAQLHTHLHTFPFLGVKFLALSIYSCRKTYELQRTS